MSLLQPGPRYGYQLKTEFEAVTGGVWKLNVGQVYTTLDRLERDGYVHIDLGDDDQKLYTLTPAGREELGSWWEAIPSEDPPPRDELMLKVLMAIEHGREHALGVITRQRTALFALLQRHRRDPGAVVARFIAAIEAKDIDAAAELLADDISYENMPVAPIVGRDAVRSTLEGFLQAATAVDWPVARQVVSGSVVINERNDRFQIGSGWLELAVAGFFEVNDDGRISLWRDYFDMGSYVSQLTELSK